MSSFFRGRGFLIAILILILVISSILLVRPVRAISRQSTAGEIISGIVASRYSLPYCELQPVTDGNDRLDLQKAVSYLNQSIQDKPSYTQSYLLLGQAYCLLDEPSEAVAAFAEMLDRQPGSPQAILESGFASERACAAVERASSSSAVSITSPGILTCHDAALMQQIRTDWISVAIDANQFLNKARAAFIKVQYADVPVWYQRAVRFQLGSIDNVPAADKVKWSVASILSTATLPEFFAEAIPVQDITGTVTIPAAQFHWFRENTNWKVEYGDPIDKKTLEDRKVGLLFWDGPAGTFIRISREGWYQVTVQAQNSPPAPVLLQLEDDFKTVGKIELDKGDETWETFQFKVLLSSGIHLIDLNFLNDGTVNGADRNAVLGWIKIEPSE